MSSAYLGLVFVYLFLFFRQDRTEWSGYSWALWIPLLWLVSTTTRLIAIWSPLGNLSGVPSIEASVAGDPVARAVYIILLLFGGSIFYRRRDRFSEFFQANRAVFILYAYVLLTILWSGSPWVSFKRYINIGGSLLMAFIVASEGDHHKALEHLFRRYATICVTLSLFYVRTNRSIGYVIGVHGEHFMAGIASHKNELGILCMFSLIFLFWRAMRQWPKVNYFDGLLMLMVIYLLLRAQCTTAIVLSILGIGLLTGLKVFKNSFKSLLIFTLVLLAMALPILIITLNSPSSVITGAFFSATGKDATISGRIPMWKDLIRFGRKDLIFGTGYESYWIDHFREIWSYWSFCPTNAHNGFVEVLLNTGLVGLFLSIGIILRSVVLLGSEKGLQQPAGHWALVFLIMFIFGNLTEVSFLNMTLGWTMYLMIMANFEKSRLSGGNGARTSVIPSG